MTTLMNAHSLQMSAGQLPLFDNLELSIQSGDRIGLIGANGCGKSTLLALLAGQMAPHGGRIQSAAPCRCEFVAQHLPASLQGLSTRAVLLMPWPERQNTTGRWTRCCSRCSWTSRRSCRSAR